MTKEQVKQKAEAKPETKAEVKPEVKVEAKVKPEVKVEAEVDVVKLYFPFDAIVDDEVVYPAGEHEVPKKGGSAERWIKRGAQVI